MDASEPRSPTPGEIKALTPVTGRFIEGEEKDAKLKAVEWTTEGGKIHKVRVETGTKTGEGYYESTIQKQKVRFSKTDVENLPGTSLQVKINTVETAWILAQKALKEGELPKPEKHPKTEKSGDFELVEMGSVEVRTAEEAVRLSQVTKAKGLVHLDKQRAGDLGISSEELTAIQELREKFLHAPDAYSAQSDRPFRFKRSPVPI